MTLTFNFKVKFRVQSQFLDLFVLLISSEPVNISAPNLARLKGTRMPAEEGENFNPESRRTPPEKFSLKLVA